MIAEPKSAIGAKKKRTKKRKLYRRIMTRKERTIFDGAIKLLNGVIREGKNYPESDMDGKAWNQWAIKKATRVYNAIVGDENE